MTKGRVHVAAAESTDRVDDNLDDTGTRGWGRNGEGFSAVTCEAPDVRLICRDPPPGSDTYRRLRHDRDRVVSRARRCARAERASRRPAAGPGRTAGPPGRRGRPAPRRP